jgi:Flp pilus assembly protein TadG
MLYSESRNDQSEKGQSLVEMAISLMVILLLLAGAIDAGMAFFSYVALYDAAEEGAIYGSINPTDSPGIEARVRSASSSPVNLKSIITVTVVPSITGSPCRGGAITVRVTYAYRLSMPFAGTAFGTQTIPLTARVTNTILNPKCP